MNDRWLEGVPPPHDLDAEAAVLSAVLLDPSALAKVPDLRPDHFYSGKHLRIFEAVRAVAAESGVVDETTVGGWLKETGRLAEVGGSQYIGEILDASPAVANVAAHAEIVRRKATQRELVLTLQRSAAEAHGGALEHAAIIRRIEDAAARAGSSRADDMLGTVEIFAALPSVPYVAAKLDLCPGAPSMIGGYGFSGKTVSCQSLALSVALGRRVWDCPEIRTAPGPVVHFDYEQGQRLTSERYQRLTAAMGVDPRELSGKLRVCVYPRTYLDDDGAEDFYVRRSHGAQLVVIDSFRAGLRSGDENDSRVRRFLDMLARVSERNGCTVLVIHHARKPKQADSGGARAALRGSGAIFDACNSVMVLESSEKGAPVVVHHEKARTSGALQDPFALVIEDVDVDGNPRGGLRVCYRAIEIVAAHREAREARDDAAVNARVLSKATEEPGLSRTSLVRAAKVSKQRGLDAVRDLLSRGDLVTGPDGGLHPSTSRPPGSRSGSRFYGSPPKGERTGTEIPEFPEPL